MAEGSRPVVIVGAGPVGLAAASHLLARGLSPLVLEAGAIEEQEQQALPVLREFCFDCHGEGS